MTWEELAQKVGITTESLRNLRKSGSMRSKTRIRLELALQWMPGSVDTIRAGFGPVTVSEDVPPEPELRDEIEEKLWSLPLPPQERIGLIDEYRRQHGIGRTG